jgi:DNA-binding CsgD family transcriptional regulator
MRRGRPRHNDVLTPREWQVLDLLRRGLTNDQIASQLAISADTAKFHVSEILAKLGVQTRQEAADWQGRPRALPGAGLPAAIAGKIGSLTPLKLAGAAVIVAAAVALAALAGLVILDSTSGPTEPTLAPDGRTGNEQLDALIEDLLQDDAAALATRFSGVTAREGQVVGGNAGGFFYLEDLGGLAPEMRRPLAVPASDWAARLGSAQRSLHAVVNQPREPFAWWRQSSGPAPPAGVFLEPRDFDIVLVVGAGETAQPWRFSILEGRIIDVAIVNTAATPSSLASLTPSADDEPGSFLVIPPEQSRPPPRGLASGPFAEPSPPPSGVASPTFAPDGRTGDSQLDALIEALLHEDAGGLESRGGLPAREVRRIANTDPSRRGDYRLESVRVSATQWPGRLASASRSLYAVYTADPADAEILLTVHTSAGGDEAWQFGVLNGKVAEVEIRTAEDAVSLSFTELAADALPSVPLYYERFYVLPPQDQLPPVPPSHAITVRTGDPGVDRLLTLLETRDADALLAAIASPDQSQLLVRQCFGDDTRRDQAYAQSWSKEVLAPGLRLHAVASLPDGYEPAAEHLIILVSPLNPYRWQTAGILERNGLILGVIPTAACQPQGLYPPSAYLVPPPETGVAIDNPTRRSGIPAVDAVIDALQSGDEATIAALIQYGKVPCAAFTGLGSPPKCPDGVAPGTPVDALERGCEGSYFVPPTASAQLIRFIGNSSLYALVERPPATPGGPPVLALTLAKPQGSASTLLIQDGRITRVETSCPAPAGPIWAVRGTPDFLLSPP